MADAVFLLGRKGCKGLVKGRIVEKGVIAKAVLAAGAMKNRSLCSSLHGDLTTVGHYARDSANECRCAIGFVGKLTKKLFVVGKGNKKRIVYLTDVAVCSLKSYLKSRTDNNDSLFVTSKSPYKRMTPKSIQCMVKKIGAAAHVENVHPHRFRHTCCTRLLCRGMPIQNVSRILGHANVNTTMWYNNTSDEHVDSNFRLYSF